ncbi:right-handed parallel beta-helix repeat-containing protein [Streptomyces sp. 4N509B]|uniref:right-handed parallel beta-helix repeat-containing protein n=1 Tax=Streptomyces sp. 4N509B TaxID=3457413 RepID=UPI003FD4A3EB
MGRRAAPPIIRRRPGLFVAGLLALASAATALTATATANVAATEESPAVLQDCGGGSYQAEAVQNGGTWTAPGYSGGDMLSAMRAAVNSLTPGRTSNERVVVRGSGNVPANASLDLPSYTTLDVCGTITSTGSIGSNHAPIRIRGVRNVEVQNLSLRGNNYFGIFIRNAENVTLRQIDIRLGGTGLGIRIDNHDNRNVRTRNVRIDNVYAENTGSHGVETYGVDGFSVGTVTARDTGESGLLLNDTINADIGRVDAQNAGSGTGYAAFRVANRNGRIGDSYPTNIYVGEVIASGGGRGVFCVSESGGMRIDRISLTNTGNNAVLLENCYNVNIAAQSGTVSGGGEVRLASRTEFPVNRDITLQNLTLSNTSLRESPCGTNIVYRNITLNNSSRDTCS